MDCLEFTCIIIVRLQIIVEINVDAIIMYVFSSTEQISVLSLSFLVCICCMVHVFKGQFVRKTQAHPIIFSTAILLVSVDTDVSFHPQPQPFYAPNSLAKVLIVSSSFIRVKKQRAQKSVVMTCL